MAKKSAAAPAAAPATTGAEHRKKSGLKPIACELTAADYEAVYQAAHLCRVSMAAFARQAVADAAKKVLSEKSGK